MAEHVTIFEMSPRDGLQNEKCPVSTADKVRLINMLTAAGFEKIEAASFVSPTAVPQMADGGDVLDRITRGKALYTALTPNMKGYERARAAQVDEIAVFAAATEGFSQANIRCSIAESLERFKPVAAAARTDKRPMRGYVSCVVVCPYEGDVAPEAVAHVTQALLDLGCYEVSLGDTVGHGTPEMIDTMLQAVLDVTTANKIAGHYHDTNGRALDNITASLARGIRTFDASAGGLGGCPFAPGARGNVATEDVVDALERDGFTTGINKEKLAEAAVFARSLRADQASRVTTS